MRPLLAVRLARCRHHDRLFWRLINFQPPCATWLRNGLVLSARIDSEQLNRLIMQNQKCCGGHTEVSGSPVNGCKEEARCGAPIEPIEGSKVRAVDEIMSVEKLRSRTSGPFQPLVGYRTLFVCVTSSSSLSPISSSCYCLPSRPEQCDRSSRDLEARLAVNKDKQTQTQTTRGYL